MGHQPRRERKLCPLNAFRLTRATASGQVPSELWFADLDSGLTQRLFPGQLVTGYDVSRDDRVVAAVLERDGKSGVWVAWLDGREPPRRIPRADGDNPRFGRDGEIVFRAIDGNAGVLYRIRENGERREKITDLSGCRVRCRSNVRLASRARLGASAHSARRFSNGSGPRGGAWCSSSSPR